MDQTVTRWVSHQRQIKTTRDRPINDALKMLPFTPSNHRINNPHNSHRARARAWTKLSHQIVNWNVRIKNASTASFISFDDSTPLNICIYIKWWERKKKCPTKWNCTRWLLSLGCRLSYSALRISPPNAPRKRHNFIHERKCEIKEQKKNCQRIGWW